LEGEFDDFYLDFSCFSFASDLSCSETFEFFVGSFVDSQFAAGCWYFNGDLAGGFWFFFDRYYALGLLFFFDFFLFDNSESDFALAGSDDHFYSFTSHLCRAFSDFIDFELEVSFSSFNLASESEFSALKAYAVRQRESDLAFVLHFDSAFSAVVALPCFCERGRREERQRGADHACDPE